MGASAAITFSLQVSVVPESVIQIAEAAGQEILAVYNSDDPSQLAVEQKVDLSPLTLADKRANSLICTELQKIAPHVPIVSEETKLVPYETRKGYQYWWCVDPLDGTKEFVKRNGQFTVNIALVRGDHAILGVVHTPCLGTTHWAAQGRGAFLRSPATNGRDQAIHAAEFSESDEGLVIMGSASHQSKATEDFIAKYTAPQFKAMGSSLKFMLVAEGKAHVYPRLAPTSEWDSCASQVIVEEAGGEVLRFPDFSPLKYGKENPLNPHFVVYGKRK